MSEFDDLFVSKQRFVVVRLGDKIKAFPSPEGNYKACSAESIELFLTEPTYPPGGIEVFAGSGGGNVRIWKKVKQANPRAHPSGYTALANRILS